MPCQPSKLHWTRGKEAAFGQARLLTIGGLLPDELTRARKRRTPSCATLRGMYLVARPR